MSDPPPMPDEAVDGGLAADHFETWLPPASRDASTALMLGILGFATCGLLSPLAVYYGSRALHEIEDSGGVTGGESNARVGQLLGIVGTTFLVLGIVLMLIFVIGAWDFWSDVRN